MTSFCTFASYLASLNPQQQAPHHQNEAISPADSTSSLSSAEGSLSTSPTKRPRADSPDTSVSSSSPAPDHYFTTKQLSVAPTPDVEESEQPLAATAIITEEKETITLITAPVPSSTCLVRSILCATFSDYIGSDFSSTLPSPSSSSPPLSRPLSRRSSTGCSTKSVRFARCTNASVFPALSIEEYDRSPIIPTTESESLELPKRKRGEAEGWIKCVERERAAAAKRGLDVGAAVKGACGSRPSVTLSSLDNPVEGVHGLIEGGYFVGEERDVDESFDETEELDVDGMMVVDDEEDLGSAQALIQDDSSGDEDLTEASEYRSRSSASLATLTPHTSSDDGHSSTSAASSNGLGIERINQQDDDEDEEDDETRERREKEEERARSRQKCRERYGLCALGKYTRQEVFQSYDSLGGF